MMKNTIIFVFISLISINGISQITKKNQYSFIGEHLNLSDGMYDFDIDGHKDYFIQEVAGVFYYRAYPGFNFGEVIELKGKFERHNCEVKDFDNDGDLDVFGVNAANKQFVVNYNLGNNIFEAKSYAINLNIKLNHFTAVDVTNDKMSEIFVTSHDNNQVNIFTIKNDSLALLNKIELVKPFRISSFKSKNGPQVVITNNVTGFTNLNFQPNGQPIIVENDTENSNLFIYELKDINNDSLADLVTATNYTAYLRWGQSDGKFGSKITLGPVSLNYSFDLFDVDSDNDLDLIFPRATEYTYSIFKNEGNGNFIAEQKFIDYKTSHIRYLSKDRAIIDGEIFIGLANPPLTKGVILYEKFPNHFNIWAHDLENDGDVDVYSSDMIFNNRNGAYIRLKSIESEDVFTKTMLDYNNDGKIDIAYLAYNNLKWQENLGNNNFSNPKLLINLGTTIDYTGFMPADFDSDGKVDFAIRTENDKIYWLKNLGTSLENNLRLIHNYTGAADKAESMYPIDFNNDGYIDIITSDGYSGGMDLFENKNGSFSGQPIDLVEGSNSEGLVFIDLNGDGYKDIVQMYRDGSGSSYLKSYINSKSNSISSQSSIATISEGGHLTAYDLNGDNHLDLSVTEDKANRLLWFLNDRNGGFSNAIIADGNIATPITGDVYPDYHTYFKSEENNQIRAALSLDKNLYITDIKTLSQRNYKYITTEKCENNNTILDNTDDFKSFELLALDNSFPTAEYEIYTHDKSFEDIGQYGRKKKFDFPIGTAGTGDKLVYIKNSEDGALDSFTIEDKNICFALENLREIDVLMAFYREMSGPTWNSYVGFNPTIWANMYKKYDSGQTISASEHCSLPGVKCINNNVTQIVIENGGGLKGPLTSTLSLLKKLEVINLKSNSITALPPFMKNFTSLKTLNLFGNTMEGSIPEDIGKCTQLVNLDLGANLLTGTIPASITQCLNLENFILGGGGIRVNKIGGTIPNDIGNLIKLKQINFIAQPLSGVLPESMGNLTSLEKLLIFSSKLGGQLPPSLANIKNPKLNEINLNGNSFIGCIPEAYKTFCSLPRFFIKFISGSKINSDEFCATGKHSCDFDNDGDGFVGNADCDDSNPLVNINGIEAPYNDIDENCDGIKDQPCMVLDQSSHHIFENSLILCEKLSGDVTLFPDGNRNQVNNVCFESGSQYSSYWTSFKAFKSGKFYFEITPQNQDDEIDFALYRVVNPNDVNSLELVRCNKSTCPGPMGLTSLETDTEEDEACLIPVSNNNHLADLMINKDEIYALQIVERNNRKTTVNLKLCGQVLLGMQDKICEEVYYSFDKDNDGHNNFVDCDETNPDINPSAQEIFFNTIDEDCDGLAELPCIDRSSTINDFSSFEKTPVICTKEPLTYQNWPGGKDKIFVKCDQDEYTFQTYVTIQKIKIKKGGSFYFTLRNNGLDETTSFAVYKTKNNFDKSTLEMVRCCLTSLHSGVAPISYGLSPFETDEYEGAYDIDLSKGKNGFVKSIDAQDGDEYVIYMNSFKPLLKTTTTYCGTATFVNDDTQCDIVSTENISNEDMHIQLLNNITDYFITYKSNVAIDKISIVNQLGQSFSAAIAEESINVANLNAGYYFIVFEGEFGKVVKGFVKI